MMTSIQRMKTMRTGFLQTLVLVVCAAIAGMSGMEARSQDSDQATLGILLDTSVEMGFLIPQARKEIRLLNANLVKAGRTPVVFKEIEGASIDRSGSITVPGRRNIYYVMKDFFEESGVDAVYWITALQGIQSGEGFFMLEQLFQEEGNGSRRLVIRNTWQDQLQARDSWLSNPPEPELDPLGPKSVPQEWYHLVQEAHGVIARSWVIPPRRFVGQFGFPREIISRRFMQLRGSSGAKGIFDTDWAKEFHSACGLHPMRQNERWPTRITGRRWMTESSLIPFIDPASLKNRSESAFRMMCERETIEEDLSTIEAENLGVLFGMGYVGRDLERVKEARASERPLAGSRMEFVADTADIVSETRQHEMDHGKRTDRVYHTEFVDLVNTRLPEVRDPYALQIARLVRTEKVDAIYFFTNGYRGGGEYGACAIDVELMAQAIREAGVRLYVRMPFEFGPAPFSLQRLAIASGGGVFQGIRSDDDWSINLPEGAWPQADGS